MFSFKAKQEQADPGKGSQTRMLLLCVGVQRSHWGPGDRLTRGELLCLGLGLKSFRFVTPSSQKSRKNFQLL